MSLTNPVFNVPSPDAILMAYGNDPQRIGEAVQNNLIPLLPAALALTKRQHFAASQQQMPQQTVAQKLFNPQQPQMPPQGMPAPGGLGATPQAAAMPQMSQMPQMGVPQIPEIPADPMEEAPAAYAEGGLTTLPIPDTMFDEPDSGGYANGGILAFADGDAVPPAKPADKPAGKYGFGSTFEEQMALLRQYAPQQDKYGKLLNETYEEELDPEKIKARTKQDMWYALAKGAKAMLETPGSFLSGLGAGVSATGEQAMESKKQRRADKLEAVKALATQEGVSNKQAMDAFNVAGELQKAYGGFMDNEEQRNLQERMNRLDNQTRLLAERIAAGSRLESARIGARSAATVADKNLQAQMKQARQLAFGQATKDAKADMRYRKAIQKGDAPSAKAVVNEYYQGYLQQIMNEGGGLGTPELASDFVIDE